MEKSASSLPSSSIFHNRDRNDRQPAINWAESWYNAADSWTNDPQGLLTEWKLYQQQLQTRPPLPTYQRPWIGGATTPATAYAVGLYRGELMELIKQNPQLLSEFVATVGATNLTKALEFARRNPVIAYGAPNQYNLFNERKAEIFADLSKWIRDLAARQDTVTSPSWYSLPSISKPNVVAGGQVSSLAPAVSILLQLLLLAVAIAGGLYLYNRFK